MEKVLKKIKKVIKNKNDVVLAVGTLVVEGFISLCVDEEGSPQKGTTKVEHVLRRSPKNLTTSFKDSPVTPQVYKPSISVPSKQS